jgi:hypothetical protein
LATLAFTTGACTAGLLGYTALSLVGGLAGRRLAVPVAALAFLLCLWWYARNFYRVPFGRSSVQANKALIRGWLGVVYFGALLGVGLLTEMSTPLVWAGALYSVAVGPGAAATYGIAFGLGRSTPAIAGGFLGPRVRDHHHVGLFVVIDLRSRLRWVGLFASTLGLLTAAALLTGVMRFS